MFDSFSNIPLPDRWREQQHPAPVVVAIISRQSDAGKQDDGFLLICRNSEPYPEHWALVGGKWDFGETLAEAVTREVWEETGLRSTFVALRGVVSERLANEDAGAGQAAHFLIFVCRVDASSGEAREQHEGALGWFTMTEIDAMSSAGTIIASDYAMLRRFSVANTVSFVEAAMLSGTADESGRPVSRLVYFTPVD